MVCRQVKLTAHGWLCLVLWSLLFWRLILPVRAEAQVHATPDGRVGVDRDQGPPAAKAQSDLATKNVLSLHALEANMPLAARTDRAIMVSLGRCS